jgi:membrane protease YdiL (CAAX protease family)
VVATAVALTAVAWLENGLAPWSPYYVVYAAAATLLPLLLGTYRFGPASRVRWWHWLAALALAVVLQAVAGLLLAVAWPALLEAAGVAAAADFPTALARMLEVAAARLPGTAATHQMLYLGAIVLWAGLGEELFYRGYVQGTLRRHHGAAAAILVASLLFAVRHATQLALVEPYPWAAAGGWVLFSFVVGLVLGWLYERTGSLWLPVVVHYAFNVIPLLGMTGGGGP